MGMMVLALKVLAVFTLSVGALSFESVIFITKTFANRMSKILEEVIHESQTA